MTKRPTLRQLRIKLRSVVRSWKNEEAVTIDLEKQFKSDTLPGAYHRGYSAMCRRAQKNIMDLLE